MLFLVTLAIAITGYLRELALAKMFGAGGEMDAFFLAIGIVQTVHDLLFAGSLSATVVPLLNSHSTAAMVDGLRERARFIVTMTLLVTITAGFLAIAIWIFLPAITDFIAPRLLPKVRDDVIAFGRVLVWLIPANGLTTLFTLVLNAHGRFILAASAYLINNLLFFAALFFFSPSMGAQSLPIAALAGPLLVLPILVIELARVGLLRPIRPDLSCRFLVSFWSLSRMILLSLGVGSTSGLLMVSHLMVRSFAAGHEEGAIAALGYAFRLYEVPLSLLANPTATVVLPTVAGLYVAGRMDQIAEVSSRILLWGLVLLFPAAFITWWDAEIIVYLLLGGGNFDSGAAAITAQALRGFAPAIMSEAVFVVFFRYFYALRKPGVTVCVSISALIVLFSLLLLTAESTFIAIPLSLAMAFSVAAVTLLALLVREVGWSALPKASQFARWLVAATLGFVVWKLAFYLPSGDALSSHLTATAFFLLAYFSGVGLLLTEARAAVKNVIAILCRKQAKNDG
jgi:putative peptidoglycan lipid II flippase